jgi:hypothetical protein
MKSSHKKLVGLVILLLFLVPLGMAAKKVYRELRQPELDSALIAAVKRSDTAAVVALLREGAMSQATLCIGPPTCTNITALRLSAC